MKELHLETKIKPNIRRDPRGPELSLSLFYFGEPAKTKIQMNSNDNVILNVSEGSLKVSSALPQNDKQNWIASIIKHKYLAFAGIFVFFGLLFYAGPRLWQDSSSKLLSILPTAHSASAACVLTGS